MNVAENGTPEGEPTKRSRRRLLALAAVVGVSASGLGVALYGRSGGVPATRPDSATHPEDPVETALRRGRPSLVQFGANACAACREMKPVIETLQREHGARFTVMSVDLIAQKHRGYLQRFRIQLMPTQVFFDAAGIETHRNMGTMTAAAILARLEGRSS